MIKTISKAIALIVMTQVLYACAAVEGMSTGTRFHYKMDIGEHYVYVSEARDECWLSLSRNAQITPDMVRAFNLAVSDLKTRKCATKWIALNSPGGYVEPAYLIGRIIRDNQLNTSLLASASANCASACGIIFISGVKREIPDSGTIGFHQMAVRDVGGKKTCVPLTSSAYSKLRSYALEMLPRGAALRFTELASLTECNQLNRVDIIELQKSGIVTGQGGIKVRLF